MTDSCNRNILLHRLVYSITYPGFLMSITRSKSILLALALVVGMQGCGSGSKTTAGGKKIEMRTPSPEVKAALQRIEERGQGMGYGQADGGSEVESASKNSLTEAKTTLKRPDGIGSIKGMAETSAPVEIPDKTKLPEATVTLKRTDQQTSVRGFGAPTGVGPQVRASVIPPGDLAALKTYVKSTLAKSDCEIEGISYCGYCSIDGINGWVLYTTCGLFCLTCE